jgi:hypothetical protein
VVLIVGIVLAVVLLGGGGGGGTVQREDRSPKPGESAGGPANVAFVFGTPKVETVRVTRRVRVPDLKGANAQIRTSLSRLYDQAIVDRTHWANGPPAATWNAFAPAIRAAARGHANAFTLGRSGPMVDSLAVSSSSLTIRYLIDDHGRLVSAQASTVVRAAGELEGSRPIRVYAAGEFLLSPVSKSWLVTGYPKAWVTVTSPGGPSPAVSGGSSPSGSSP